VKGVIACPSNKDVKSVRTLTGDFKALVRIQCVYGGIVSEVRWQRTKCQLNFQITL